MPIREITENLGADVKWNNKDKSIKISLNGDVINMKINSPNVSVNGKKVSLDNAQAPQLALYSSPRKETKTMVPLRFISETFGYDVDWNNDEVRAEISTDKSKSIVDGDDKENLKTLRRIKILRAIRRLNPRISQLIQNLFLTVIIFNLIKKREKLIR